MKRTILFRGTGTALVTPFTSTGAIDESVLRKLVDFQINGRVEAILPTGTTGESVTLSDDEQLRVVEIVLDQARGRVKIIAGAGSNATAKAIAISKRMVNAEELTAFFPLHRTIISRPRKDFTAIMKLSLLPCPHRS